MQNLYPEQKAQLLDFIKIGLSHPDVAAILGIGIDEFIDDKETLRSYALGNAEILESLYNMATSSRNASAAVFLANRRCYRATDDLKAVTTPDPPGPSPSKASGS